MQRYPGMLKHKRSRPLTTWESERVAYYFLSFYSLFISNVQSQLLIRVTRGHRGHGECTGIRYSLDQILMLRSCVWWPNTFGNTVVMHSPPSCAYHSLTINRHVNMLNPTTHRQTIYRISEYLTTCQQWQSQKCFISFSKGPSIEKRRQYWQLRAEKNQYQTVIICGIARDCKVSFVVSVVWWK